MISLTIDGKPIQAEPGTSVLNAARQNGIKIPTLCDHPNLTPYGGCRLCVVEVKGLRAPMASCTLPVSQGMVVETDTQSLRQSRQVILSLLFSERNHFCPFCQVSGNSVTSDCELQQAAYYQDMTHWPMQPQWNKYVVDTTHPYFILDNNRCILCRRCVRACAEMSGNFTLSVEERGAASVVVADTNTPLGQSSCVSCGSCVQVCPTGALIDRTSAYQGSQSQLAQTKSVCVGCSVGCGINVITRDQRLVRIEGDWESPVSRGVLCKQGRFLPVTDQRMRLTTPLVRVDGELRPASWEEALDAAAQKLQAAGANTAALVSPRLPIETLQAFKSLFKDSLHSQSAVSLSGEDAGAEYAASQAQPLEGRLELLSHADCVLAVGTDLTNTHEVAGFMIKRNLQRGVKLIVIAPQESDFANLAHYTLRPGAGSVTDVVTALQAAILQAGMSHLPDQGEDAGETLARALSAAGLDAGLVSEAAQALAQAAAPVIVYESDLYASPDLAASVLRLAQLSGAVDGERQGLISLKGAANSLAAAQLHLDGALATYGSPLVYLALGDDQLPEQLVRRLHSAAGLVVQAAYASELTEKADVVLPAAAWAEQPGAYLNLEGRLQQANAALPLPAGVYNNTAVLQALAQRLQVNLSGDWRSTLSARPSLVSLMIN